MKDVRTWEREREGQRKRKGGERNREREKGTKGLLSRARGESKNCEEGNGEETKGKLCG